MNTTYKNIKEIKKEIKNFLKSQPTFSVSGIEQDGNYILFKAEYLHLILGVQEAGSTEDIECEGMNCVEEKKFYSLTMHMILSLPLINSDVFKAISNAIGGYGVSFYQESGDDYHLLFPCGTVADVNTLIYNIHVGIIKMLKVDTAIEETFDEIFNSEEAS